ncbi:hypothetical protein PRIC1_007222 [Phytophthora ramorum]
MLASSAWKRQKVAATKVQCWLRQRRAIRNVTQIRDATLVVNTAVLGWFMRWQYERIRESTRKLQQWWRRASKERSAFAELLEAVLCIQSAWKRRSARKWFEREWQRQETFLSELEATICIQAAWRGRHQRRLSQSQEPTPRLDDDSVIEALLYSIIAVVEADAVDRVLSEQSTISATPADLTESEGDIKHILTDLLEAVARLSEPDAWESRIEGLNGSNVDAAHVRTDSIVDPISPSTAANYVEQENVLGDDLNAAGSDDVERPTTTDDTTDCCMNLPADVHNEILEDSELDAVRCVLESIQDQVVARAHDEVFGSVTKDADKLSAPPSDGGVDIPTPITDSGHSLNEPATASEEEGALQQPSEGESGNESDSTTNELEEGAVHQQGIDADQHSPLDQHSGDSQKPEAVDTRTRSVDPDQPDASSNGGRENNVDVASNSHGVSEHEVVDPTDPDGEANGQILIDADLSAAFDTDTTAGDFAVPNDSDSDDPGNEDNSSDEAGSSIDSADLMLEADEMAILQDTSTNPSVVTRAARHRKTERLDSVTLLSDLDQLDAQSTKNPPRHRENH